MTGEGFGADGQGLPVAEWQTDFSLANRANDLADAMPTMLNVTTGQSRCGDIEQLNLPLLESLPVSADVDSPDFRYENFAYHEPVPRVDNGSVERERTRYAQEKAKPDRLIGVRLAGGAQEGRA